MKFKSILAVMLSVLALAGSAAPKKIAFYCGNYTGVFSRAFAKAIGVTETVSSPTYTIIQEYPLEDGGYFYHMDLYRIKNSRDALAFAVDEYLNDSESYALLEWPERISDILPPDTLVINIRHLSDTEREITVGA